MKAIVLIACVLALVIPVASLAQKAAAPAKVTVVQQDKATDFTKFKTYTWGVGHKALDPAWDKAIVAAIDAQLAAKGLKPATPADVVVTYHSIAGTAVDLSTFDDNQPAQGAVRAPAKVVPVGTLVVDLRDSTGKKTLWRVMGENIVIDMAPAGRDQFVSKAVASLFALYPKAPKK